MKQIVNKGKKNIDIRMLTLSLVRGLPPKDWRGEVNRIHEFVRDEIRYVRDIKGVETLQSAPKTLEIGQGDCDDKATLAASMLETIGHPSRFVAMGFNGAGFSHVLVESKIGNKWVVLETTQPWALGRAPRNPTSRLTVKN